MHTATVLREEIFAVEVVVPAATTVATFGVVIRVAEAFGAAVEAQLEVLRGDVAFPFVLGGEDGRAAVVGECAGELLGEFLPAFGRARSHSRFGVGGGTSMVGVRRLDDFIVRGDGWGGGALEGPCAAGGAAACAATEGGVLAVLRGTVFGVVVRVLGLFVF